MTYISLVGTQIMAVLNPLLALIEDGGKPETVVLLATPRSLPLAETIRDFLTPKGYAADNLWRL